MREGKGKRCKYLILLAHRHRHALQGGMYRAIPIFAALALAGCASPDSVAPPKAISIQQAMADVGAGFGAMKRSIDKTPGLALNIYPCQITATFAVQAAATESGHVGLTVSAKPPTLPGRADLDASAGASSSGLRANTVTVTMESRACLLRDILAASKSGAAGMEGKDGLAASAPSVPQIVSGLGRNFALRYRK